ncbi:hypothetical protein AHAS_Ahas04G0044800 [Arachis hypogaea]
MIQDDKSGGDGVGHADHHIQSVRPQHQDGSSKGTSAGPGDRPAEHAGAETQEVPFTYVSSSQIYHDIHGQMYDDLAGPTFTMDMDHEVRSSQFYSDFTDIIRDDDPPHFQQQTPQDQPQLHVDLNAPAGSPYDNWLGMGGTPASVYGVGMPVDPPSQQRQRPARVRCAARCGTGSHLLGTFGHDSDNENEDRQEPCLLFYVFIDDIYVCRIYHVLLYYMCLYLVYFH